MCKKMFCTIIIITMICFISIPVMANPFGTMPDPFVDFFGEEQRDFAELEEEEQVDPFKKLLMEIISDDSVEETPQFIATLTKPALNVTGETVFSSKYIFTGCSAQENIGMIVVRYNEESEEYEEFFDLDNDERWDIEVGISSFFTKEIKLSKGRNKLKIIIFKKPNIIENPINDIFAESYENRYTGPNENMYTNSYNQDYTGAYLDQSILTPNKSSETKLKPGKDVQIKFLTVNVLDENTKNSLINNVVKIEKIFNKNTVLERLFKLW